MLRNRLNKIELVHVSGWLCNLAADDVELTVDPKEAFIFRDPEEKASGADSENDIQS